jgi:choline-sulfatase
MSDAVVPEHPIVSEYHAEGVQAPSAMIRSGAHKLIVSREDPDLLYDLVLDPLERSPVDRAGATADWLRESLAERLDLEDIGVRVRRSQRERHLVSRALRQGRYTSWDFQPPPDSGARYVRSREDLYELQRRARLDEPPSD